MSSQSQNPFLNMTGTGTGRETPAPLLSTAQALPVPTNVPFVTPQNIIPNNISDYEKFNPLNQLARALGGEGGIGTGGFTQGLLKVAEAQKQKIDNQNMSKGLLDAATKAAKTRDLLNEVTTNGVLPASKNPMYQLGYQVQNYSELATQYRNELIQARLQNPGTDPAELQDQLKQKYLAPLQQGSPDLVYKFFIKPSQDADKEDVGNWQKNADDDFKAQFHEKTSSGLAHVIDSELALYHNGQSSLEKVQGNTQRQFESTMQNMAATGIPYKELADTAIDTIINRAKQQDSLTDKEAILNTLTNITMPTGNKLLDNTTYAEKYIKAKDALRQEDAQQRKLKAEADTAEATANTNDYLTKIAEDSAAGKLGNLPDYFPATHDKAVNYKDITGFYNQVNSSQTNTVEQGKTNNSLTLTNLAAQGDTAGVLRLGSQLERSGLIPQGTTKSAFETAHSIQRQNQIQNQVKIPNDMINERLKTINPPVPRYGAGRWSGYSDDTAMQAIPFDLRQKYKREVISQIGTWLKQNPGADQLSVSQKLDSIVDSLQPQIHKDYDSIKHKMGSYSDIVGPLKSTLPTPQTAVPKPQPKAFDMAQYTRKYPFAMSQQSFQIEKGLFNEKKGTMYQWLHDTLEKKNRLEQLDDLWKVYRNNPDLIIQKFQQAGYPTWKGQVTQKNPQFKPLKQENP